MDCGTSRTLIRVSCLVLCLFCARGLAQFEDLLDEYDESANIGNVTLIPPIYSYAKYYGDTIGNITCDANCSRCTYEWIREKDGKVVSDTPTVSIGQIGVWNAGNYTCKVSSDTNDTASTSFEVALNDTRQITNIHMNTTNSILLVPPYTMIPVVSFSANCYPVNVPCTFSWLKDNRVIRHNNVLDLGNMTYSAAGQYLARTSVGLPKDEPFNSDKSLDITDTNCKTPPCAMHMRLNPPNVNYEAQFNSSIPIIECQADCYPFCEFIWIRLSDGKVVSKEATINLIKVTYDDFAKYQCVATAIAGKSNIKIASPIIEILYSGPTHVTDISISTNKTTIVTILGIPLHNVTCTAHCLPFECEYTWTNVVTRASKSSSWLNELIPGAMKYEYIGYYECSAQVTHAVKGQIGTSGRIVVTDVDCEKACSKNLRFVPPVKHYSINIGGSVEPIQCQADCSPPCFFQWMDPNKKIISHSDKLVLKNLKDSDFGIYQCSAYTNDSIFSTYSLTISKPEPSDSPDVGVIVGSVLGGVAALALIAGIILFIRYRKKTPDDSYKLLLIKDKSGIL